MPNQIPDIHISKTMLDPPVKFSFGWKNNSGLICVSWKTKPTKQGFEYWSLHFGVQYRDWIWFRSNDWYNGLIRAWGCGPIFLLVGG